MSWICSSRVQCKTERLQQDQPPTPVLLNTGTASLNIFTIFFLFSFLTKYVCIQDSRHGQVRIFSRITLLNLIIPASDGGNQSCAVMASDHHCSVMCGYWNIEHILPDLIYSYQATQLLSYSGQNNVSYNLSFTRNSCCSKVVVRLSVLEVLCQWCHNYWLT